ncbi:alpha/beta hydrolase [Pseudofrankia asymbiotica]|uniref:alpha/beta hydrolase n=1 Tax=Pseudofrankia asymbiotica TaxID=1834516 RepID=UPI000975BB20|nr:alpha/beta hydrolase [Pseudofrankia asymbiotica]
MATFVLIHGGGHGGWCWERAAPLIHRAGHHTVAPDLPMDDVEAGVREWADVICSATSGETDVILVGHSMAGLALPVVASMRPVLRMVFVAATVPLPGMSWTDYIDTQAGPVVTMNPEAVVYDSLGRSVMSKQTATEVFYHDCPPGIASAACERLRPIAFTSWTELCPINEWPNGVPSSVILGAHDRVLAPTWIRAVARDRLHTMPVELPTGHSPFYAAPQAFVDALLALTNGSTDQP